MTLLVSDMKYLIIVARVKAATGAVVHLYDVPVNVMSSLRVLTCLYNPYNIPKVGVVILLLYKLRQLRHSFITVWFCCCCF